MSSKSNINLAELVSLAQVAQSVTGHLKGAHKFTFLHVPTSNRPILGSTCTDTETEY